MRKIFFLSLFMLGGTFKTEAQTPLNTLNITPDGEAIPVFIQRQHGCDRIDIPDAPARAIRLENGQVQLYTTQFLNRLNVGKNLLQLTHKCDIVFQGKESSDPAAFSDRSWITSPYTLDGKTVYAVIHNEFQGHRHVGMCPTGRYMDCWYNTLTWAVSEDGGKSFKGNALVASLPYRYDQVVGQHRGYFNPSNIVSHQKAFYMFAFATKAGLQKPGNCLMRTQHLKDPNAWRGWNGTSFDATFINPYTSNAPDQGHVCEPIGVGKLKWPVTSLVHHLPSKRFIATMLDGSRDGGIYYAISPDLLHWSDPKKIMPAVGEKHWTCEKSPPISYPSLLDPESKSPNFETVGNQPFLFVTRFNVSNCRTSMNRDLLRIPLKIEETP